jgi:capsular polysaccharide biosynthesis protein
MNDPQSNREQSSTDEIDIREIIDIVWKGKWFVILVTILFSVASVFYVLTVPDEYKSTTILSPNSSPGGGGGLSKLAGQFGGLASLAGVSLGGSGGSDKTAVAMELMKTWGFLESFIRSNSLELEVYASIGWDKAENSLILDDSLYDTENSVWRQDIDSESGKTLEPSSWLLYKAIKDRISISKDPVTGLIILEVEHFSPYVAKKWADLLVLAINKHMQLKDREDAIKSINYLNDKVRHTDVSEMLAIFYQLIEEQTKTLMLAEVSDEYVFKTLSMAKVPEEKFKPKRALMVILGCLFGGVLSVMIVLFKHFLFSKNN